MSQYSDLKLLLDVPSAHKKIIEKIKSNSRVLEIGTNTGYMTQYLNKNLQCEVTGIEIDKDALVKASPYLFQMLNVDVNNLDLLNNSLIDNHFDYIIMSDVLEHLFNTLGILNVLSNKINTNGEIIISMPNANHNIMLMQLLKNDFCYQKTGFLDKTHIRFFTTKSFENILSESSLEIVNHTYTYMTPDFEDISNNHYNEFNLFEKEVLLRHLNGHFFQNIFTLKKKKLEEKYKIKNIDAYWFDQIEISLDDTTPIIHDVFDSHVDVKIPLASNNISTISFKPSIRLRGIQNLVCYLDSNKVTVEMNNFICIDNIFYSFNDTECCISIPKNEHPPQCLSITFDYIDISEIELRNIFQKAADI